MERTNAFVVKWRTGRNGDNFHGFTIHGILMDTRKRCSLTHVSKVAEWMNRWKKSFDSGRSKSRLKGDCRRYFSVSLQRTQACRATGNPYESICGVNGEGVTLSHFCYAFLPDDENDVWLRELSCPGCTTCADPDYRKSFLLDGSFSSDVSYRLRIGTFYIVSKRLETCSASASK